MAPKRRDKGEGSFWQDKHGQWWAKATHDRHTKRARATDRSDAKTKALMLAAELALELDDSILNMTLREWIVIWLAAKKQSKKPSTYEFYKRHAGYATAIIGDVLLRKVEARHVRMVMDRLGKTSLKPQSIAHVRAILRNALNMAMKEYPKLIERNAASATDAPHVPQYRAYAFTVEEQDLILDAVDGVRRIVKWGHTRSKNGQTFKTTVRTNQPPHRLAAMVHLEFELGFRLGELLALTWKQVDFTDNTILVEDAKTESGWRTSPFTEELAPLLKRHKANQEEEGRFFRQQAREAGKPEPIWNPGGFVFCSETGTQFETSRISAKVYKMFLRWAGLDPERYRFHDLRHTAITEWIDAGADPKTAQTLAGHSTPEITMRIYAHARASSMRPAVEAARQRRRKRG